MINKIFISPRDAYGTPYQKSILSSNLLSVSLGGRPLFGLLLVGVCFFTEGSELEKSISANNFAFLISMSTRLSVCCVFGDVPCSSASSSVFISSVKVYWSNISVGMVGYVPGSFSGIDRGVAAMFGVYILSSHHFIGCVFHKLC